MYQSDVIPVRDTVEVQHLMFLVNNNEIHSLKAKKVC